MARPQQQKRLAAVLRKTLKDVEAKSETDASDPAFIQLKSQLLQRIIQLDEQSTRARAVIHLVDTPEEAAEAPAASDSPAKSAAS